LAYAVALCATLGYASAVTMYVLGVTGRPFQTALLVRADAALGFSWPVWAAWVARHRTIADVLSVVYAMHLAATAFAVATLALRTQDHALRYMRAYCLAFGVTAIGQLVWPALTNTPNAVSNTVRYALRDGTFSTYNLTDTVGLISFPSMHATLGVLVPIALWRFRRWRVVLAVYGPLMLAATPTEGGHHLVDVLAGAAIAVAAAWLTRLAASD
jgi:membrane-associated phospholipid phosphatase